jgi:hypothetical protein
MEEGNHEANSLPGESAPESAVSGEADPNSRETRRPRSSRDTLQLRAGRQERGESEATSRAGGYRGGTSSGDSGGAGG